MKINLIFLAVLLLSACGADYGHRVVGDNLTVYFADTKDQDLAENVAVFWRNKDLMTTNKQDLQLVRKPDLYELRIIANEPKKVKDMPFEERKLLLELQNELADSLFKKPLQLVICNANFEPVYNINQ